MCRQNYITKNLTELAVVNVSLALTSVAVIATAKVKLMLD